MTPEAQFWANWWIQAAVAVGTFGTVLVALFGQGFRAKFFPPKLSLVLNDAAGELTKVTLSWLENGQPKQRTEDARYYHLRVSNRRRWSPAHQAQVFLTRIEGARADGTMGPLWVGDIPIAWRHQEVVPPQRTIGPEAFADLCSVIKDKHWQLHPLVAPFNMPATFSQPGKIVVSLQVRSNEADSDIARFEVAWDGKWHDGALEMQRHLVVKAVA
jgi:hypothetical protein